MPVPVPSGARVEEMTEEDADAQLQAEEDAEESEEQQTEIQREIDGALEQQHMQAKEEMMKLLLRSLAAEHKQQQQQEEEEAAAAAYSVITGGRGQQTQDDEYDEDDAQSSSPSDESFVSWLRSSLLPTSASLSAARLSSYGRFLGLKTGRLLWNVSTGLALLLLPVILAQQAETLKVQEINQMLTMEARIDLLERQGGAGGGAGGAFPGLMPATAGGPVPANAPAGYVPPPVEVSGIPAAGGRY